jgi:predicted enzyme related to lactoylglutathione lyase
MKHNPVNWFEIYVQDMARAKQFYESVFQLKLEKINNPKVEMWSFPMDVERFGAGGALAKMEGVQSGGNSTVIYFICTDCAVETARVTASGGRIHKPKIAIGEYGFIALCFDTEGNLFGLHSMQ